MKINIFKITLLTTFIIICSCKNQTITLNKDKNKEENIVLSIDTLKPNCQYSNKFKEIFEECRKIPNGYNLVYYDQMHQSWKEYLDIKSPNYFESDLNGDKDTDYAFIIIDSNMAQSLICIFLSSEDDYNFYIIDSAKTYENKNQIIIYPKNLKLLKTEYDTYKLKYTSINSIFIWSALEYTYYWNENEFEKVFND